MTARAYEAYGKKKFMGREYEGVLRSTFLIGPDGRIEREWRSVKVDGHAQEVLNSL
jgi:peroxiredoxin Q/BCP